MNQDNDRIYHELGLQIIIRSFTEVRGEYDYCTHFPDEELRLTVPHATSFKQQNQDWNSGSQYQAPRHYWSLEDVFWLNIPNNWLCPRYHGNLGTSFLKVQSPVRIIGSQTENHSQCGEAVVRTVCAQQAPLACILKGSHGDF